MEITTQLQVDQAQIEDALRTYAAKWPAYGVLKDAMSYSLLSGGKRIRPVLVLEICKLFGGTAEDALPFACGLEMVHTYSLIHDDLPCMDDDDFRRGKPTNHKVFGQANAVLAGDALLTTAFAVLAEAPLPAERVQRGIAALADAAGPNGMVGGQVLDLLGEGNSLQEEEILAIESLKTGCMIEAAARLGAIAAGEHAGGGSSCGCVCPEAGPGVPGAR
ncbi:MAG: polyprenyl synthetase family protein [Evtepia gabavorous]